MTDVIEENVDEKEVIVDNNWDTVHAKDSPHWLQEFDDYIPSQHRPILPSLWLCVLSCFRIHSETINIWTHFTGAILFIILLFVELFSNLKIPKIERVALAIATYSSFTCCATSCVFHTFCCYSLRVSRTLNKMDYIGIAVLITGSSIPCTMFLFIKSPNVRNFHIAVVSILGTTVIIMCLFDTITLPNYRVFRTVLFISLAFSVASPLFHYAHLQQMNVYLWFKKFNIFMIGMSIYLLGALAYATKIPERLYPGKFNIWFQSHQIFHVCVIIGALIHLDAIHILATEHLVKYI